MMIVREPSGTPARVNYGLRSVLQSLGWIGLDSGMDLGRLGRDAPLSEGCRTTESLEDVGVTLAV